MMPEMQLPHLLHLLAHHPELEGEGEADEEEAEGGGALQGTQRCLDLFLGTVCSGGAAPQYDLLRVLLSLVKRAPDRMAPTRRAVHVVADVARSLIGERTKGGWVSTIVRVRLSNPKVSNPNPNPTPTPTPNQVSTIVPESIGLPRHLFSTEQHAAY